MTVKEIKKKLNLNVLVNGDMGREITGCYCGDLLSWVMSRASEGDIWLTVMGNINSVAVCVLADCACIVLTENSTLDEQAKEKAETQGVTILSTTETTYDLAVRISKLI